MQTVSIYNPRPLLPHELHELYFIDTDVTIEDSCELLCLIFLLQHDTSCCATFFILFSRISGSLATQRRNSRGRCVCVCAWCLLQQRPQAGIRGAGSERESRRRSGKQRAALLEPQTLRLHFQMTSWKERKKKKNN